VIVMTARCDIQIGTSGWHYKHWMGKFYPKRLASTRMLSWYSRRFSTVEINNSFYRLPTEAAFATWRRTVPPGFVFSVKASRFLTHMKRLRDPEAPIELFFSRAFRLGESLGPVLFQLPPKWNVDASRLEHFLKALPCGQRYAFEFRDQSWNRRDIFELLRRHNAALCLHDWGGAEWKREMTANFTYVRFHGFEARYGGDYPKETLKVWADRLEAWGKDLTAIFVYFNNDAQAYAISNAQQLMSMVGAPSRSRIIA